MLAVEPSSVLPPAEEEGGEAVVGVDAAAAMVEEFRMEQQHQSLGAEQEAMRLEQEKEAMRLEQEQEAMRLEQEQEAMRLEQEQEAMRLEQEEVEEEGEVNRAKLENIGDVKHEAKERGIVT
jgi:hypothetical protein